MRNLFKSNPQMITGGPQLAKMLKAVIDQEKRIEAMGRLTHGRDNQWHAVCLPHALLKQRLTVRK